MSYTRFMRALVLVMVVGCYVPPAVTPGDPDAVPEVKTHRSLVTDQLPYHLERDKVRAWHAANDWCIRRVWPQTDEFVVCNTQYINLKTPPMYSMASYDVEGKTIAYATFTPVPCRMYGRCDGVFRTVYASEHEFVDHSNGLYPHLAERGRGDDTAAIQLPSMQLKMFDALAVELDRRFGAPEWQDPHRFGATWMTTSSVIGLFVAGNGGWVVETHEMRVPSAQTAAL
jgi:hypothetical protein